MHSLYAKITFVSTPLFPDVYFVSYNDCVFIVSSVAILGYNICVCHLLSNKEISIFVRAYRRLQSYEVLLEHGGTGDDGRYDSVTKKDVMDSLDMEKQEYNSSVESNQNAK